MLIIQTKHVCYICTRRTERRIIYTSSLRLLNMDEVMNGLLLFRVQRGIRRSNVCSLLDDIINIVLLEQYKLRFSVSVCGVSLLLLWPFRWVIQMQLWEVATWGAFEWSHLHLGWFCLLWLRLKSEARPKTLLNLPRCKHTAKGSVALTTVEGFHLCHRAFEQSLMLSGLFYLKWGESQYFHERTKQNMNKSFKCN